MRNLVSGVAEPWEGGIDPDSPVIIATPQPTSDPVYTPTPDMFQLTATAYFGDFPTAIPQSTPMPAATNPPMIQPTQTPIPLPTVFVCQTYEDATTTNCVAPTSGS